jgi:GNAT superfamily N-acetyltransferase
MLRTAGSDALPELSVLAREGLVHERDADDVLSLLWRAALPAARVLAERDGRIIGCALGSLREATASLPATGHVDLILVAPGHRHRGIGTMLLAEVEARLLDAGARRLRVRGNPPHHAWPGVDIRYTEAVCLVEGAGYHRLADGDNMLVDLLAADLDSRTDEHRLAARGVEVRRLRPEDRPEFWPWVTGFGGTWAAEAERALARTPAGVHVALRDGAFLGFACHGVTRVAVFGPMGTDPAARGLGIGTVLLKRCLADQRAAGVAEAEIGWVGPVRFYSRTVGARLGRVFRAYQKDVG